jgi:uncharacterized membrane protein YphA (DoxX/SURF4 family)
MKCSPEASDREPEVTSEHRLKNEREANREVIHVKDQYSDQRASSATNVGLWALQISTAAAFFVAGIAKLSDQPMMVETFDNVGIGQWFRYVTGGIEVVSAIMLLIPRLTPVGAALLVCTMTGAVLSHLVSIGGSPLPALVLGCFAAIILRSRLETLKSIARQTARARRASGQTPNAVTSLPDAPSTSASKEHMCSM